MTSMVDDAPAEPISAPSGEAPRPAATRVLLCVVDNTAELSVALQFASLRSARMGARVGLLYVIDSAAEFQHWATVGDLMREEARAEAEQHVLRAADRVVRASGRLPIVYIREGDRVDEVIAQVEEDPSIRFLVLAADTGSKGPGPLVSALTGRAIGRVHIPVVIVPGNLSDEELRSFA